MSRSGVRGCLAGLVLVATGCGAAPAAHDVSSASDVVPAPWVSTVTLVTGDRVTLGHGPHDVTVRAGKGREGVSFRSYTDERGDVHTVPADAAGLVASGRLDPRLFNVTGLVRAGYDDAERADLPLIVDYPGATPRAAGARVVRELPAASAVALLANKDTAFWSTARTAAGRIWLDGRVRASLEHSVPQIGAPMAWAGGDTGAGTTVAVLDTGIDTTHPDLDDAVRASADFTGSETGADDHRGHGTHVASIVTGSGDASGGRYQGVAPDAELLNGKVLDDSGNGLESWAIAGMEWAARTGADVISMSLGGGPTDGTGPMDLAVDRLTAEAGALFVIAAGNDGPGEETVTSPGSADAALTVGAVDHDDQLAEFSSRGPRVGDGAIKPDITAPGVGIVAARAAHGQLGEPAADGYVSLSGTSMATPHVAGAAAILAARHPDWTAGRLKSTLTATARPNGPLSPFEEGAGRLDVAAAVRSPVSATPSSVSAGTVRWPHADDQPIVKTLSYTNSGAAPVTLDLAAGMTGPGGAAPAGMVTARPGQVSVPAGGTTEVTLTIDTTVDAPDGQYLGAVTATGGGTSLRTPVAVVREVESYDVEVTALDHDGEPTPDHAFLFMDLDSRESYAPYDESGTAVARLPKGTYYFDALVRTARAEAEPLSTATAEPSYVVDGDAEIVVDARDGTPIAVRVDEPNARSGVAEVSFSMGGSLTFQLAGPNLDDQFVIPSTTSNEDFTFGVEAALAEPDDVGGFHASPYLYHLRWSATGRVPDSPERTFRDRDLAKVRSHHAVATPGTFGLREDFVTGKLPFTLTEYYTPNVPWYGRFYAVADPTDPFASMETSASPVTGRVYRTGEVTHERWNVGVFGPAFPTPDRHPSPYIRRLGDRVDLDLPLHADQPRSHDGFGMALTGTTELVRDGELVGRSGYPGFGEFLLPAEPATFTLRATATREGRLSTVVDAEWTFRSAHVPGDDPVPLPLLAVRFAPELSDHNEAPAGRRFRIPVHVQRNASPDATGIRRPTVEVSFDDGSTWRQVPVSGVRDGWVATVDHPRNAEFVSLRSSTEDENGNAVTQTIVRAYALS